MLKYLKNNLLLIVIIGVLIILGTLFIMIDGKDFIDIFSIIAAIYLFIISGWMIFSAFRYKDYLLQNENKINQPIGYLVQGFVLLVFATIIIIFPSYLVRIIIGITLIILPLISLITHENKKLYLRNNFWKFIVGLLFIIAIDVVLEIIFIIIGSLLIIASLTLIYLLIINYKDKNYPNVISKYLIYYIINKNKER